MSFKAHLFICTNSPDRPGKCGHKGSEELRQALKTEFKGRADVRINASGCLGFCERGIAAVMYPQATWWTELTKDSQGLLSAEVEKALQGPNPAPAPNDK